MAFQKIMSFFGARNALEDEIVLVNNIQQIQSNEYNPNESNLREIVSMLNSHHTHPTVSTLACHVVSVLALDDTYASFLVSIGTIKTLGKTLRKNKRNEKVAWKCCSALWNICRTYNNVPNEYPSDLIDIILDAVAENSQSQRVVHTAFGALANLALMNANFYAIQMTPVTLRFLKTLVERFSDVNEIGYLFCNQYNIPSTIYRYWYINTTKNVRMRKIRGYLLCNVENKFFEIFYNSNFGQCVSFNDGCI